jgi:hypothetical protein
LKVYGDDPNLPYKTTKLKALYTKSEIDDLFAKWCVKDVYWRWDPEHNDVFVQFKIEEDVEGVPLRVSAKFEAPSIWDHRTRSKAEGVNWGYQHARDVLVHQITSRSSVSSSEF